MPPSFFKQSTLDLACCYGYSRDEFLLWIRARWTRPMTDRQAGWTVISQSMFDRTECKIAPGLVGPYVWFWEDQLLGAFKAIIFISHPQWAILISDEGASGEEAGGGGGGGNEQEEWTSWSKVHSVSAFTACPNPPLLGSWQKKSLHQLRCSKIVS